MAGATVGGSKSGEAAIGISAKALTEGSPQARTHKCTPHTVHLPSAPR